MATMESVMKRILTLVVAAVLAFVMLAAVSTQSADALSKPGRASITSVSAKSKSSIKVKWKKVKGAKGYQLRYSLKSGMKRSKSVSTSATTRKISKLKAGKKYYFQVRAYKKKGSKKVYGKWSTVKSAYTKKAKKTPDPVDPDKPDKPDNPDKPDVPVTFSEGMQDFSVRLLQNTVKHDNTAGRTGNVLVSPDSVMTALGMLENGAEGKTLSELESLSGLSIAELNEGLMALHSRLSVQGRPIFTSANSIWTRNDGIDNVKLGETYMKNCKDYYGADFFERPFDNDTVSEINNWVYNNTRQMIDNIIDNLDPDAKIVLVNALAFEGDWAVKFEKEQVKKETFTKDDGTKVEDVNMLNGTVSGSGAFFELNGGQAFAKDYENHTISFVGILPPENVSLDAYIAGLSGADFTNAWKARRDCLVKVKIPEFKYDYDASLAEVLKSMGATRAFTDNAEFATMTGSPYSEVKVDDVLHKTHIELNRNGTKAAAATAVVVKGNTAIFQPETREVYLTRPFVYALVDNETGVPLFIGAVRTVNSAPKLSF